MYTKTDFMFKTLIKRSLAGLLILFSLAPLSAQLTIKVLSVPSTTPPNGPIHIVGSFNNWNPGDPARVLSANGNGQYSITLNIAAGPIEFKFTRGSWATVEGNASGNYLPNRTYNYAGGAATLELNILTWEDLSAGSTAASNVQVLDNAFYMPQLNRNRRIWLYLPPDYFNTTKRYPVLYMHDGQNLFDQATSFSGEWKVDESLNALHQQGDYGCIVVGIDNGGQYRLDEYSPWVNPQYGGGQGDAYVEFITNTLKPHIDSLYRTLPDRVSTGIMGSSMGGLISMYAFSERQDVFSRAGIFSPAFWFAGNNSAAHTASHPKYNQARVYFLSGGQEPAYVTQDMQAVADAMLVAGFGQEEQQRLTPTDGQHSEWFWAREFSDAYKWLFTFSVGTQVPETAEVQIFPNPAGNWVRIADLPQQANAQVQIFSADGKLQQDTLLPAGQALWTGDLAPGFYWLKVRSTPKSAWLTAKLIKS